MPPVLKQIPLETDFSMRAPYEHIERAINKCSHGFGLLGGEKYSAVLQNIEGAQDQPDKRTKIANHIVFTLDNQIVAMHGLGHPIEAVKDRLQDRIAFVKWIEKLNEQEYVWPPSQVFRNQLHTIAILTLPSDDLEHYLWNPLFKHIEAKERVYILDHLQSAFRPDYKIARKYTRNKFAHVWADPVHKALTQNPYNKEAALAQLMEGWPDRVSKFVPLDWEPWREEQPNYTVQYERKIYAHPNFDFAYEIALAVCAYDLDDANFRDHPYYPRDLVDYYRANIRNTRDAWRAQSAGPTLALEPYVVKRIDLSKKKANGFRRWLDIASDGDPDAVGEAIRKLTNLRKVKDLSKVISVMGDYGIALAVDLKDDETCESELARLINERKIGEKYTPPKTKFEAGSGRCEELLGHAREFIAEHGFRMIYLSEDGDWDAVVINQTWEEEFRELSKKLGVELS